MAKSTRARGRAAGAAARSGRQRKPFKQTPLAEAFPLPATASASLGGRAGGMVAASATMAEALDVIRGTAGLAGLGAGNVPALMTLLKLLDFATVEEALTTLRAMRQTFADVFKVPGRVVEGILKTLEAKAKPIPVDEDAVPLAFGLATAPALEMPPPPDFLLPLGRLANLAVAEAAELEEGIGDEAGGGLGAAPVGISPALGALGLPTSVNLINLLPNPVRNQGLRNTCVSFATAVAYEQYLSVTRQQNLDLSEQFFHWSNIQRDAPLSHIPEDGGTYVRAQKLTLEQLGACTEATWGYSPAPNTFNPGHGPPPAAALSTAGQLIPAKVLAVRPNSVEDIKFLLSTGRCVVFGVPVWSFWWNNSVNTRTGRIKFFPGSNPDRGHAMCIVGYQDDASNPALGGGRFIVRNSHGTDFGSDPSNPYGGGHGTIAYSYIAQFGNWPAFGPDIAIAFE